MVDKIEVLYLCTIMEVQARWLGELTFLCSQFCAVPQRVQVIIRFHCQSANPGKLRSDSFRLRLFSHQESGFRLVGHYNETNFCQNSLTPLATQRLPPMSTALLSDDDDYDVISNPGHDGSLEDSLAVPRELPPLEDALDRFETTRWTAKEIQVFVRKQIASAQSFDNQKVRVYIDGTFDTFGVG